MSVVTMVLEIRCSTFDFCRRFTEALGVAKEGRAVADSLDAPPALTSTLDNNVAAILTATGRWAEADQLLTELMGESSGKATHYLELLQLELAVGRGDSQRAASLAAALAKAPPDPGLAASVTVVNCPAPL